MFNLGLIFEKFSANKNWQIEGRLWSDMLIASK